MEKTRANGCGTCYVMPTADAAARDERGHVGQVRGTGLVRGRCIVSFDGRHLHESISIIEFDAIYRDRSINRYLSIYSNVGHGRDHTTTRSLHVRSPEEVFVSHMTPDLPRAIEC